MHGEDELLEAIASLYDAACEIVPWSPALSGVARNLDSRAATLFRFDSREKRIVWLETSDSLLGGVQRDNAALEAALLGESPRNRRRLNGVAVDAAAFPAGWAQVLVPSDAGGCSAVGFEIGPAMVAGLALQRPQRPMGPATKHRITLLMPHIRRALQLHWRQREAAEQREVELTALDRLSQGLILLNRNGIVLWKNQAAGAVLAQKDGLLEVRGGLRAARPDEDRELQERIAAACSGTLGEGGTLAVTRPSLRRPLWLSLAALHMPRDAFAGAALARSAVLAAVIFVCDPERSVEVSAEHLREAYRLTPAEARLAAALVQGLDLGHAAARFGIAKGTARIQLKAVLAKTNTHSQAELIQLLASGLGALVAGARSARLIS